MNKKTSNKPTSKAKKAKVTQKRAQKTAKLGSGKRFDALSKSIQADGKSKKEADAIAASIGRKKYGAKKMTSMSSKKK